MIIAVDGPAASGKGTLARQLAHHYGFHYLDTGALYRAIALAVLANGGDPENKDTSMKAAQNLKLEDIDEKFLRTAEIAAAAATVSAHPGVRSAILNMQREFAKSTPGAILDGRDIGTVVCPEADIKLFIIASAETRAHRRFLELKADDSSLSEAEVLETITQRDKKDETRKISPLIKAGDAHLLDTTNLDIETAFQAAIEIIDVKL